ncbi:MAG: segregation ATPase FtsK/SpoIIIE, family [Acidobacteriota bacterium]|jgi:S-DNA-T family DNA segregation ATPase FtsK/SpoIIIE|nr:segregation ATPase FtsK/SpoIIIE, family [Acidobacteriota bacterium]
MATTQTEARSKAPTTKNTRRNEIIAILLFALGALLALCLFSYKANDPSWNAAGQNVTRNWIGPLGANIAAGLFQFVGLAAYLLPLLLLAAAWRRFRTRRIRAPLSRIIGLITLVVAAAALFAIFIVHPLFDASVPAGGLAGALISRVLVSGLSTTGATILLLALAATGLLLATNFSFVRSYEWIGGTFGDRFAFFRNIPERFNAWRAARSERARLRMNMRRQAREERNSTREAEKGLKEKTAAERVAEFMQEGEGVSAATAIKRAAIASESKAQPTITAPDEVKALAATASSAPAVTSTGQGVAVVENPATAKRSVSTASTAIDSELDEAAEIEAMLKSAEVVRTEVKDEKSVASPKQSRRAVPPPISDYKMPDMEFLKPPPAHLEYADDEYYAIATRLAEKCKEFNVTGKIEHICPGPVVTTYEFKPDPGVKYSRVTGLVDDLCLALKAESIRIDRLPGKAHVGIEVPSPHRETIHLREVIESRPFRDSASKLTIALGKTIDGLNYIADLAKMPHLLIAGTTGAGKSVGVNSLIVSILYKATPDEVKFILVDPKRLELGLYEGIPHLKTPIITDPKRASHALKWAVAEMEKRYKDLAGWGVRNIDGFNTEVTRRNLIKDYDEATNEPHKPLPYIVIIIDELADLMMVSGHEVEESITRLAQMARAVGIHLVLATQRPSVDVITGLIKANFPSRISFRVSSKVDSRTIIDSNGAEQLLGRGDMLFLPPGTSRLIRVHGAYVDESEIGRIVSHIKAQGEPLYDETVTQTEDEAMGLDGSGGERDELFEDALRICVEMKRASTSVLQRRLRIGYGRAAAILDMMEREGFIGQADGARPRPVLSRASEILADWDEESSSQ